MFSGQWFVKSDFIEAPEGIIAIDTGESNEEMRAAIAELRLHTKRPIVAVLYKHFHNALHELLALLSKN